MDAGGQLQGPKIKGRVADPYCEDFDSALKKSCIRIPRFLKIM
jgi:hypothetical protein